MSSPEQSTDSPRTNRLERWAAGYQRLSTFVTRSFYVLAILVTLYYVTSEWTDSSYVLREVSVPTSYSDAGFGGNEMAHRISTQLRDMVRQVSAQDDAQVYRNQQNLEDISVDLVGVGIPVRAFVRTIGKTLGIGTYNEIRVAVGQDSDTTLTLVVRVSGKPDEELRLSEGGKGRQYAAQQLALAAAKLILKHTDPAMLSRYYANHDRDGARTVETARLMLEQYPGDDEMIAKAYAFWSFGYILERKFDLAVAKAREGLQLIPDNILLQNSLAYGIGAQGHYQQALDMSRKLVNSEDLTRRQRCVLFLNMGNYAGDLHSSEDSALHYYHLALQVDPHFVSALYNVALSNYYKGDTTAFYEYFERALKDGVNPRVVFSNPEFDSMATRPHFRALKEQFLQ